MLTVKEKRKGISKKLRFEVFTRDNHTCQYCGGMPPEVTLEIDHKYPHVDGGTIEKDNLITACFDCNRGKSNANIEVITQNQAASLLGVTARRLRQMSQEDNPPDQDSKGQYPAAEYGLWMKERLTPGSSETLDLTAERTRLTKEQADKTATENKRLNGELVETQAVMDLWVRGSLNLKTRLLNIPTKVAPLVVGKPLAKAKDIIDSVIREVLNDIANSKPLAGIGFSEMGSHETPTKTDGERVGR